MAQNAFVLGTRYFLIDLVGGIVFFPLWWYSRGLARMWRFLIGTLRNESRSLAIGVWIKNLFVPMYGAYDIWGRLISFFMRVVQIIARTFVLLIFLALLVLAFIAYIFLPVFLISQILFHAVGVIV